MMKPRVPRSIIHVDDDPALTRLIAHRLQSHGIEVQSIHDPSQALSEILRRNCRLVLLDIDMPHCDGVQLLRQIKATDGGVQAIMLTGFVTLSSALESYRLGAEACFFKPLTDFAPLVEAIQDTFRKIDRWWETMNQLSHQLRCTQPAAELSAAGK